MGPGTQEAEVSLSEVSTSRKREQKLHDEKVPEDELKWRQIGSGMWARTFMQADRLAITTKSGPIAADVERRIVRDADTGKLIDDCRPADTADDV